MNLRSDLEQVRVDTNFSAFNSRFVEEIVLKAQIHFFFNCFCSPALWIEERP